MNTNKILDLLNPTSPHKLQDEDKSIINLKNLRKKCIKADDNNVLRIKLDCKGKAQKAILLPKVLRPWIITSTHEFNGHQGGDHCYQKMRATYFWSGMKNCICQVISNCKICKMESPNLGRYMNLD